MLGNESSMTFSLTRERIYHVTFAPGSECSREQKFHLWNYETKVRGNKSLIIPTTQISLKLGGLPT